MDIAGIEFPLRSSSTKFAAAAFDKMFVGILEKSLFDRSNLRTLVRRILLKTRKFDVINSALGGTPFT